MSIQPLIDLAREREGLSTDDVLASLLPLFRQVAACPERGLVAPLEGIDKLGADEQSIVGFDEAWATTPRRDDRRIAAIQRATTRAFEITGRAEATADITRGDLEVRSLDVQTGREQDSDRLVVGTAAFAVRPALERPGAQDRLGMGHAVGPPLRMGVPRLPQVGRRIDVREPGRHLHEARDRDLQAAAREECAPVRVQLRGEVEASPGLEIRRWRPGVEAQRHEETVGHEEARPVAGPEPVVSELVTEARDQLLIGEQREEIAAQRDDRLPGAERERRVRLVGALQLIDRDRHADPEGIARTPGGRMDPGMRVGLHAIRVAQQLGLEIVRERDLLAVCGVGRRCRRLPRSACEDGPSSGLEGLESSGDLRVVREGRQLLRHVPPPLPGAAAVRRPRIGDADATTTGRLPGIVPPMTEPTYPASVTLDPAWTPETVAAVLHRCRLHVRRAQRDGRGIGGFGHEGHYAG